mgnify:FL=1
MTTAQASAQPEAGPSSSSASTLTPALFKRLHPRPYLEKFLGEGVRPDGRLLSDKSGEAGWREASVNVGESESTADGFPGWSGLSLGLGADSYRTMGVHAQAWRRVGLGHGALTILLRLHLDRVCISSRAPRPDHRRLRNHPRDRTARHRHAVRGLPR